MKRESGGERKGGTGAARQDEDAQDGKDAQDDEGATEATETTEATDPGRR
ncbi:MAG: hypothetical protein J6Y19_02615 [Kiritimatiellae bacterium]|nr:hypothetical protein [Kiritimatiellia bacterium]